MCVYTDMYIYIYICLLHFSDSNLPTPEKSPAPDLAFKGTFSFFAKGDVMRPTISGGIPVTVFIKPVRVSSLEFTSEVQAVQRCSIEMSLKRLKQSIR